MYRLSHTLDGNNYADQTISDFLDSRFDESELTVSF